MSAAAGGRRAAVPLDAPVPFDGRTIVLPRGRYDWLHLVVRARAAARAEVWLHYAEGGTDPETLTLRAGAEVRVRVPVTRRTELDSVRLPEHDGLALLALTTVAAAQENAQDPIETGLVTT